ncbi:MAG: glycine hydroxymethyltransferase [Nitrospinota bacterium]|nr:glycine hydroxymethyltransferase [Nitrospinota bacterium]
MARQMTQGDSNSRLTRYLGALKGKAPSSAAAAYYASLDQVEAVSPNIAKAIAQELADQRSNIKLIASENYCSLPTQLAHGNLFTDKYAEGFAKHRFYAGCDNVDIVETEACDLAKELFNAEHAYVQPHSGVDANFTALFAVLFARVRQPFVDKFGGKPLELSREQWLQLNAEMNRQKIMGMDYFSGGHLTHGYRFNIISNMIDVYTYSVERATMTLDYDVIWKQVKEVRPLILLAGYSAYSRKIDFAKMKQMAQDVGATLWVDMAHFAGLVAGGVFEGDYNPVAHADIVTTTTHKTLRGPRGGMVLCKKELADWVDKGCPTNLGGPLSHAMAAKAVALREALRPEFKDYAKRIVENARGLAEEFITLGANVLTGGTDNHMILVEVSKKYGLTGRQAETALRACGVTLNRNALPFDENGPWYTSGLRIGAPAVTTLGMGRSEMKEIASIVHLVLSKSSAGADASGKKSLAKVDTDPKAADEARKRAKDLLARFPLYPELDLEVMLNR